LSVKSYASKISVGRPPDVVYPYLVEPEKQALWSGVPMRRLTDGPLGPGSRMEVNFGRGPMKAVLGLEMTAVEPGRRVAWKSLSGPIRWTGEYTLTPTELGTDISQTGQLEFTGLWRAVEGLVGAEIKSGEIKELEKLKAVIEAG
jgi:uncharacterized protein YndB with AHSA1/START domain